jgi:site-specific recombinase XerD
MMNTTTNQQLDETIRRIEGAYAPATIRAYRADFEAFIYFCSALGEEALPASPTAVAQFVENLASTNHKSSSIRRAIAGISAIHRLNRLTDPTKDPDVTLEMRRMHRQLGRFSKQAYAIDANILEKLLGATDNSIQGIRNRALLLVAYDTLCRRSELVSLRREDIQVERNSSSEPISSRILLRRSKTDPYAQGYPFTGFDQAAIFSI